MTVDTSAEAVKRVINHLPEDDDYAAPMIEALSADRDALQARVTELESSAKAVRDQALEDAALEMGVAAHIMSQHGSDIEVTAYQNAAAAIRAMEGGA